ncbi:MAG: ATP-binding protein [Bacteroidetes bacterium]|nr:ATP-binding protein [Bacteroidota bacterium]MBU2584530.1 ATP-binding protein [Bacteroidota bacterium]
MFINRQKELQILNDRYTKSKAEMFIIYGRRRVGKTELIRHFINGKPHVYYMADLRSNEEQLEIVSNLLAEYFDDKILSEQHLKNWDLVFTYIESRLESDKRFVFVIDEFPYLVNVSSSLPSIIQKHWDSRLKKKNIFLILCGSSMSFMEKEVLSYKSPLYGRRTGQIEVNPFNYFQASEMLDGIKEEKILEYYGVFGGIPAYLELIDQSKSIWQNIEEQIFQSDRLLYNEVNFLLMQELRTPRNYFAILRAIALGRTKINDIVQFTGLERGVVGKYLDNLINLKIVERKVPVTEQPHKSRRGIYIISDNYFRFWFRYIYPRLTYIEEGRTKFVMDIIKKDFTSFLSVVFENVCKEFLKKNLVVIPFEFTSIGSYWDRDNEIDIVALSNQGDILLGECKYSNKKVGMDVLENLISKSSLFKDKGKNFHYIIFSKSGFTDNLIEIAQKQKVILLDTDFDYRKFV